MAYPQLTFSQTTFQSPTFISRRREVVYANTLLYQLKVLKETGRYDAFKLKWHPTYDEKPNVWPVPNHLFWDSDVGKWIEGACYFLQTEGNSEVIEGKDEGEGGGKRKEIERAVKELVNMIRGAQGEDGYLNIHFTVVEPGKRFTNLRDLHELYNAGHLIEAALAHSRCYGNDLLMEPLVKYVDLLHATFGPGPAQKHGYPGHPEIELALLRLYEKTGEKRHLDLARYFIEERGNPKGQYGRHYYDVEAEARGEGEHQKPEYMLEKNGYWYHSAHKPVVEQETIEGHSVRAMYLLTSVADLVRLEDDDAKREALARLWSNMVEKKMYLTGGIGAMKQWEGFGLDYFLPSSTDEGGCYAETCAGIGVMMLAERLLQIDLDGKYGDIMELCFYNAVMTGMSAKGTQFTYVNQMASSDSDLSKRAEWFTCACCPPNVTRLLGYIGGYLWSSTVDGEKKSVNVNVHLYSSAKLSIPVGKQTVELEQKSNWPWEGNIDFSLRGASDVATAIKLRIPAWAEDWQITPSTPTKEVEKGYLTLSADWLKQNSTFTLTIPLKPRFVSPHPYTNQDIIALARGPLIYCLEDVDNLWVEDHFKSLILDPTAAIEESKGSEEHVGEPYIGLTIRNGASFLEADDRLAPHIVRKNSVGKKASGADELHFIPYALRDNRGGKGHMRVGIRRKH